MQPYKTHTDSQRNERLGCKSSSRTKRRRQGKRKKVVVPIPTLSEALYAIRTVNHFYDAAAGNKKKLSQIMDIEEYSEIQYSACHLRKKKITGFSV
jgi:hypothetical protein